MSMEGSCESTLLGRPKVRARASQGVQEGGAIGYWYGASMFLLCSADLDLSREGLQNMLQTLVGSVRAILRQHKRAR